MPRAESSAVASVERFFQLSLLGLVFSGYLAVAGSGYLDTPTIALTAAGLLLRALAIIGVLRLEISERATTIATVAYAGFFLLDYFLLSHDFLTATVHLLFFLAVMKILTARSNRDYLYTAIIAFLELLAAAILSVNFNFILFLSLYLSFAIAALTSGEIRRSSMRARAMARMGSRRFGPRLALLSAMVTVGILTLTAGLFFLLPRTAEAAFSRLAAHRIRLPGFSNQVTLGDIGEIKTSSRPVMHIKIYSARPVRPMKWRGGVLTEFDGRRWSSPENRRDRVELTSGHVDLVPIDSRIPGNRINYHVDLEPLETDALFFAGTPETLDLETRLLYRMDGPVYRLGGRPAQQVHYDAYSLLEDWPEAAPPVYPPPVLPLAARERTLQLPPLDGRIPELARSLTAESVTDLERARAIERRLRAGYGYTLQLPDKQVGDPLAYFLFSRKKGHCEYFASAMAVMLRSINIPARLATGFQSGVYNPVSDMWLMRAGDAHSWVEAWIPGHGWTTFDPTPPDPGASSTMAFLNNLMLYFDAAETFWQEWVVAYGIERQGSLAGRMEQGAHRLGIRWFDSAQAIGSLWDQFLLPGLRRYGVWILAVPAIGVLLWFAAGPVLRRLHWSRRVARMRRGQGSVADATLLYERMLHLVKRRGYQKPAWFTPAEFAASLPSNELGRAVGEFTVTYNALRFGGHAENAAHLSALLDQVARAPAGE